MPDKLIYLCGLSGAGKSTVCRAFEQFGIAHVYTGDVGRELFGSSVNRFQHGREFRESTGFISQVVKRASFEMTSTVVVDSLRSLSEWDFVRSRAPADTWLLGVVCGWNERVRRLEQRDRSSLESICRRDSFELGEVPESHFNVAALLARADFYVDTSREAVEIQIDHVLEQLEKSRGWRKSSLAAGMV